MRTRPLGTRAPWNLSWVHRQGKTRGWERMCLVWGNSSLSVEGQFQWGSLGKPARRRGVVTREQDAWACDCRPDGRATVRGSRGSDQPGQRARVRCVICMDSEGPSNDGSKWGSENNGTSCSVARRRELQLCRGLAMVWKEYRCARSFLPTRPHRERKKHFH